MAHFAPNECRPQSARVEHVPQGRKAGTLVPGFFCSFTLWKRERLHARRMPLSSVYDLKQLVRNVVDILPHQLLLLLRVLSLLLLRRPWEADACSHEVVEVQAGSGFRPDHPGLALAVGAGNLCTCGLRVHAQSTQQANYTLLFILHGSVPPQLNEN